MGLAGAVAALATHLLVVGLVLRQNLFPHLLFALVDIRVQLVPILLDREFLIIVNRDKDLLSADGLLLRVVELSYVWVLQCLLCSEPLIWIELQKVLQQIQCIL